MNGQAEFNILLNIQSFKDKSFQTIICTDTHKQLQAITRNSQIPKITIKSTHKFTLHM